MIAGIGIDVVDIVRMDRMLRRNAGAVARHMLADAEYERFAELQGDRRRAEWLAGRFAAKEALYKAIGTGIGGPASLRRAEIASDAGGKPQFVRLEWLRERYAGELRCHLSISHTKTAASAVVVLELLIGSGGGDA